MYRTSSCLIYLKKNKVHRKRNNIPRIFISIYYNFCIIINQENLNHKTSLPRTNNAPNNLIISDFNKILFPN